MQHALPVNARVQRVFCWPPGVGVVTVSLKSQFHTYLFSRMLLQRFGRTLVIFSGSLITSDRCSRHSPFGWHVGVLPRNMVFADLEWLRIFFKRYGLRAVMLREQIT